MEGASGNPPCRALAEKTSCPLGRRNNLPAGLPVATTPPARASNEKEDASSSPVLHESMEVRLVEVLLSLSIKPPRRRDEPAWAKRGVRSSSWSWSSSEDKDLPPPSPSDDISARGERPCPRSIEGDHLEDRAPHLRPRYSNPAAPVAVGGGSGLSTAGGADHWDQ